MPNKYTDKRVARMVINPYAEGEITDVYPQLRDLTFNRGVTASDCDKQFRYLAFVWDFNSPMVIEFTSLESRKKTAAIETGYKGETDPSLEIRFITEIVRNRLWLLICSKEATYYEFAELVSKKITGDDDEKIMKGAERKIKLGDAMSEIEKELPTLYRKLIEGDGQLEEEAVKKRMTPEMMAKIGKDAKK